MNSLIHLLELEKSTSTLHLFMVYVADTTELEW
jgi:hypothetical protein